ncbi:hypothetical protein PENTCL1PPCAC_14024, partial [Pristionchus entomophagus]
LSLAHFNYCRYCLSVSFKSIDKMRFRLKPARETFTDADWVSHVKVERRETIGVTERQGVCDVRYVVQHVEVFKKPDSLDELSSEVLGSTMGGPNMEEGKEYLLCGSITEEGKLSCVGGQVCPEGGDPFLVEWNLLTEAFIQEMKSFDQ